MTASRNYLVGTKGVGAGHGIWRYQHTPGAPWGREPPELVADVPSSSFVALHPTAERVYAVQEGTGGAVVSLDVAATCALRSTATVATGGPAPCHLRVHPHGQWLYVANYGNGVLAAVPLDEAGDVTDDVLTYRHAGSGPDLTRQEGPHAHFVTVSEGGNWLIVVDLGTDQLRAYPLEDGRPIDEPVLTDVSAGCGPRHLAQAPGMLYLTGELSGAIVTLSWDEGSGLGAVVDQTAAATLDGLHQLSHIERRGQYLYLGVRGSDSLSTLEIGTDGTPSLVGEVRTAAWPRHLAVAESAVIVAGERGDVLAVHPLVDGIPVAVSAEVAVPGPMCVLPL